MLDDPLKRRQLRAKLKEQGRWQEFIEHREEAKRADPEMPMVEGWTYAAKKMGLLPEQAQDAPLTGTDAGASEGVITRGMFRATTADARATIQWVFDNWNVEDVVPQDAPSPGAWFMRDEMRTSKTFRSEFYRTIYPKLLPTKAQLEELMDRLRDDGRSAEGLIEDLMAAEARHADRHGRDATGLGDDAPVGGDGDQRATAASGIGPGSAAGAGAAAEAASDAIGTARATHPSVE